MKKIIDFMKVGFFMILPFTLEVVGEYMFKNISGDTTIKGLIVGSIIVAIALRCYIKLLERR